MENDAISRSALLAEIDKQNRGQSVDSLAHIGMIVNDMPALDVAPVVRCKDCRSSRMLSIKEMITFEPYCLVCRYPHGAGVSYPEYDMTERVVAPNDYCSYGRRRTNGREDAKEG